MKYEYHFEMISVLNGKLEERSQELTEKLNTFLKSKSGWTILSNQMHDRKGSSSVQLILFREKEK